MRRGGERSEKRGDDACEEKIIAGEKRKVQNSDRSVFFDPYWFAWNF